MALKVQLKLILKQPALAKLWFQWVLIHFYTDFLLLKINFTQLDTKMDNIGILNGSNQNQLYGVENGFFCGIEWLMTIQSKKKNKYKLQSIVIDLIGKKKPLFSAKKKSRLMNYRFYLR